MNPNNILFKLKHFFRNPSKLKKPSLKINAISNLLALIINLMIGFVLTPYIINNLGKTGYGIWTLVGSFIGYYGLLNVGVSSAIGRYIARYSAQKNKQKLSEVASTALIMFCSTGLIAIIISYAFAEVIASFFGVSYDQKKDFIYLVWIVGLATAIDFPSSVLRAILVAKEYFIPINVNSIIKSISRALFTVIFLNLEFSLSGLGFAALISAIIGIVLNICFVRKYARDVKLKISSANLKIFKVLIVYGGVTTVISISDILRNNIDSFVIGKWVGLPEVGVYGLAALLLRYMNNIILSGLSVLTPRFAYLDGMGDRTELRNLFLRALSVASLMAFGISMLMMIYGGYFIPLWVDVDMSEASIILLILTPAIAFAITQNPGISVMYALNKHHYYAGVTVIEALVNVVLSIFLAKKYGIVGVALGTVIPMLISKIILMPIYVSKIVSVGISKYIGAVIWPIVVGVVMVVGHKLLLHEYQIKSILQLAGCVTVSALIYMLLCSRMIIKSLH